jgi:acetolactate synthase-1/2/3 large subunit
MPEMTGAKCLALMLKGYGATHVFMVPAVLRRTLAEVERETSIDVIHTHGEKAAAYMSDGYARAGGRPGVCMAQEVGVLNLAAGLRDAWLAHSPVIALTGGRWAKERYKKLYQDAEDFPALEPYTKLNASVDDVTRIPDLLRQAYRAATTGCPGPVHLQFAGQEGEIDREIANLDPMCEPRFAQVPPFRPAPSEDDVRAALARIVEAERPVIVAGGGVRASGGGTSLRALAEQLQIPVATSLNGRDTMPESHQLAIGVVGTYSRGSANRLVAAADLAIFIGTEAGSMTTHFWRLPPSNTRTIQVDINAEAIGRNYPATVAILADAREFLDALLRLGKDKKRNRSAWLQKVAELRSAHDDERRQQSTSEAVPIRPERICHELSTSLPSDAIVVVDTGHAGMWMSGFFDLSAPTQSFMRSAGHLGWAFAAGLGAKCAAPHRPVVTFTGDLGFWYHIGELETAVRKGISTVTIVNNNHSGNQSKRGFALAYDGNPTEKSRELWVHREVNFARLAEEIGALGIRVEHPREIAGALAQALSAGRPAVVDVVTDIEAAAPLAWDPRNWAQKY